MSVVTKLPQAIAGGDSPLVLQGLQPSGSEARGSDPIEGADLL
jgi:hypothetical protein